MLQENMNIIIFLRFMSHEFYGFYITHVRENSPDIQGREAERKGKKKDNT